MHNVRTDLQKIFGDNLADQAEALIHQVASLNVQMGHERNYNAIYGSQMRLLGQMTSGAGVAVDVARKDFEEAKSTYPEFYRAYTFEQWISFLQQAGLCTIGEHGNYTLTPYGRGFIKYIVDRRLPPTRPF